MKEFHRYCVRDIRLHYWADKKQTGDFFSYLGKKCVCGLIKADGAGEFANPSEGRYLIRKLKAFGLEEDGYSLVRMFKWSQARGPHCTNEILCNGCKKWTIVGKWEIRQELRKSVVLGTIICPNCQSIRQSDDQTPIILRELSCTKCGGWVGHPDLKLCSDCCNRQNLARLRKRSLRLAVCPKHHTEYDPSRYCGECFGDACDSTPRMYSGRFMQ